MREVLYRGKRVDNGEWVYGYYVKDVRSYGLVSNPSYREEHQIWYNKDNKQVCAEVIPETVGQWVTLSDRKGKKIFDGDILKYLWAKTVSGKVLCVKFCLKWSEDYHSYQCFAHGDKGYSYPDITMFDFGYNKDRFEVIGNIYDNSDLLE